MRQIKKIFVITKWIFKLAWRLNHYKLVEKLSLWDYLYRRRISIKTAYKVGKIFANLKPMYKEKQQ